VSFIVNKSFFLYTFTSQSSQPSCIPIPIRRLRCGSLGVHLYTEVDFEWDPAKAKSNYRKHGVRFADAVAALEDENAISVSDDSEDEERWVSIGMDALARIVVVVYTWRGENLRLISARPATPSESRQYEEGL